MRRHLPLLGRPATPIVVGGVARARLGAATIGLADTATGLPAARFASELALAFRARGTSVALLVLGYQGTPTLPVDWAEELRAQDVALAAQALAPDASFQLPAGAQRGVQLLVGLPALAACVPALSVLLGAHVPRSGWPDALRSVRSPHSLELAQARPGLAPLLVDALIERGFLPRD